MGGLVWFLVMCTGLVAADRKLTIAEKLREDADLSQVPIWKFRTLELTFCLQFELSLYLLL